MKYTCQPPENSLDELGIPKNPFFDPSHDSVASFSRFFEGGHSIKRVRKKLVSSEAVAVHPKIHALLCRTDCVCTTAVAATDLYLYRRESLRAQPQP